MDRMKETAPEDKLDYIVEKRSRAVILILLACVAIPIKALQLAMFSQFDTEDCDSEHNYSL